MSQVKPAFLLSILVVVACSFRNVFNSRTPSRHSCAEKSRSQESAFPALCYENDVKEINDPVDELAQKIAALEAQVAAARLALQHEAAMAHKRMQPSISESWYPRPPPFEPQRVGESVSSEGAKNTSHKHKKPRFRRRFSNDEYMLLRLHWDLTSIFSNLHLILIGILDLPLESAWALPLVWANPRLLSAIRDGRFRLPSTCPLSVGDVLGPYDERRLFATTALGTAVNHYRQIAQRIGHVLSYPAALRTSLHQNCVEFLLKIFFQTQRVWAPRNVCQDMSEAIRKKQKKNIKRNIPTVESLTGETVLQPVANRVIPNTSSARVGPSFETLPFISAENQLVISVTRCLFVASKITFKLVRKSLSR
jgi:hypothetical protein